MKRTRWTVLLAILMGFALVAAACGNDDDGDTGGGDTAGDTAGDDGDTAGDDGDTAGDDGDTEGDDGDDGDDGDTEGDDGSAGGEVRGVTDTEVRVGLVAQLASYQGIIEGIEARMNEENEAGGIGGRDLVLVDSIDDNNDAQANFDGAKQLVEQDGVFAMVLNSALSLPQTTDYLAENQVPFSGWGFMPGFCLPNEWGFGFNGCLSGFAMGVEDAPPSLATSDPLEPLVGEGFSLVVFNSDDTAGEAGEFLYRTIWADQILADQRVPTAGAVTDFTPYVNTVLDNEPDVVIVSTDFATAIPLKAAIIGAGYEGVVVDYVTYVPGLLSDAGTAAALEGGYSNTQIPPQEEGRAATQQIAAALEAIGEPAFVGFGQSIGYWSMDTLIQLMQAAEAAGGLSPETFNQVANVDGVELFADTPDGGLCPINSTDAHRLPATGAAIVKVEGGEYVSEVEFDCWSLFEG